MKPLVSICIPNYNNGKFIRLAIESALSQTYPNIEVIVIDNASTDKSWNIIKSFKGIEKLRQKFNMGYNRNLNTCIELAKGKYIKILHADDILEKDAVEIQIGIMEKNSSVGFVYSVVKLIDEGGNKIGKSSDRESDEIIPGKKKLIELLHGNHIMFPSMMIRKECFDKLGFFDGEIPYCNDWDMWMRICMKFDVAYSSRISASYRVYSQSGGTVRYELHDISGFQQYRCLTKILSLIKDEEILRRKKYFYNRLAKEQISRGLDLVSRGRKDHGRRYILASASMNDSFFLRLSAYTIYLMTYLGMSKAIHKAGKRLMP